MTSATHALKLARMSTENTDHIVLANRAGFVLGCKQAGVAEDQIPAKLAAYETLQSVRAGKRSEARELILKAAASLQEAPAANAKPSEQAA